MIAKNVAQIVQNYFNQLSVDKVVSKIISRKQSKQTSLGQGSSPSPRKKPHFRSVIDGESSDSLSLASSEPTVSLFATPEKSDNSSRKGHGRVFSRQALSSSDEP